MATKPINKPKGGSVCAVSTCTYYSGKAKQEGRTDISFHRFPKNLAYRKLWIQKCKRADKWNPTSAFICSVHFGVEDFIRDLQAELLGYAPKGRRLKPDAIPTLNLPGGCIQGDEVSTSTSNCKKRMEDESSKQAHDDIIALALDAETQSSSNQSILLSPDEPTELINYEMLYNEVLKDHKKLKTELSLHEEELISIKQRNELYVSINESLQSQIKQLQKNVDDSNILLKENQKALDKQTRQLSENKTRTIEIKAKKYLSSIFTKNQLDLMIKKKKKVHWSRDEISKAFTLRYFSKHAYFFVKNELNFPLPGLSSLQQWVNSIDLRNGILDDVLKIMKLNGDSMQNYEKLTVLMFDKIKVSSTLEYDVQQDKIIGPHNQMQVIMARGVASQWKQPIYVDFDKTMTREILFEVIKKLDQIGFITICCVSDCGKGNVDLWKALDVNYENPVFSIPNGREIVYIPDVTHILKLVRNWLLDTGFVLDDQIINKKPLESLIQTTSTEFSVCHKLTTEHLTCVGSQRQNVWLASQLMSHTTATALLYYKPIKDNKLLVDTANFIKLINNWFDLMNVCHLNDKRTPYTTPYGLSLEQQDLLLNKVYETVLSMRCTGKVGLQIFQKAILMQVNGTKVLLNILKQNGLKYLLTSKINQDALENLYSHLRSRGGLNDHPTPLIALHRLRMAILGKNPGIISKKTNITDINNEEFMVATALNKINLKINIENLEGNENSTDTNSYDGSPEKNDKNKGEMEEDIKEYLAGWVAKKYRVQHPELGLTTSQYNLEQNKRDHDYSIPTGIHNLSHGGLIVPSNDFKTKVLRIERLFKKITKNKIPKGPGVVKQLTKKIINRMEIEEKYKPVVQSYIKQRLFIQMRYLNQHVSLPVKKRKAKLRLQKFQRLMT